MKLSAHMAHQPRRRQQTNKKSGSQGATTVSGLGQKGLRFTDVHVQTLKDAEIWGKQSKNKRWRWREDARLSLWMQYVAEVPANLPKKF